VPKPDPRSKWLEIPAGLLEDDPGLKPDKHIFVEVNAPWFEITDALPRYELADLLKLRSRAPKSG